MHVFTRATARRDAFSAEVVDPCRPSRCNCGIDRRGFLAGGAAALTAGLTGFVPKAGAQVTPPRIDVHAHLSPPGYIAELAPAGKILPATANWSIASHLDEMDRAGISVSLLSVATPGVWMGDIAGSRRLAREANDFAAKLVQANPKRLGMFASLPLVDAEGSLAELAYSLDQLKADGVVLMTSYDGKYLGDPTYDSVFAELNRRKMVVYIHPTLSACCVNIIPGIYENIIEFGTDTTRAIARWTFGGAAEKFPDIKMIWSHAGGTMPSLIERFDWLETIPPYRGARPRTFRDQIREYYFDVAQASNPVSLTALKQLVPASRIVFGTDYPFRTIAEHVKTLSDSKLFDEKELAQVESGNMQRLIPRLKT
ncbi:amidohydrolase [Bradyrhizobium sp. 61]|uniref:amidohydrolase family protein n=1 Tax=unclassified Bradyrhizobium TaxID=2631580 RepID=UPI001FF9A5E9|nr:MULTISPECIES: amidohydrolase family protein [unclassified Bradyrhizobium]MCK1277431.1 amidohydrolase [Bradyrhizobium sp. 61]MCK1447405.1 amidohydrolase [Bradyrhizobium sp. 48]MCK1465628.1 amidohydrolase [Bradyrhizobium sp. 2]